MNRNKLKTYAPEARRDFIKAVTERAALFGLTDKKTEPMTESGGVYLIAGMPFPKAVGEKRKLLEKRISKNGFQPTMEAIAYTWFNRLVALRYMELHGYLVNGFRVLSHPDGHTQPEILEKAQYVDLPGIDTKKVVDLKLDGTKAKEEELYQYLLTSQFNSLHKSMPFLFEKIDDETELLLPDNLLHSDSLVRKLVNEIDEADWQEVEIIGWLYQFYISERKDEVIGKVVASEDIPAATQLFTPNWIVKYLVQNTLGRQWLATYPQSSLRSNMEYYIEPAEQTPEVQEQLRAITPTSLNPEELTLLDPACGSGHILVEAYDLFKAIYQERGYRARDIPALILKKNLYGLEIDDRAAQLASFALMMKARADASRIFETDAKPNIVALQESKGLDAAAITHALNSPINNDDVPKTFLFDEIENEATPLFSKKVMVQKGHVSQVDIAALVELFEHAKTFGSLIQVPPKLAVKLPEIETRLDEVLKNGDLTHVPAQVLKPLLLQAGLLAQQYDAVVANPPYMGSKHFNNSLKEYIKENYKKAKSDLCVAFIDRGMEFTKQSGLMSMITMQSWMFLSSFEDFRISLMQNNTMRSMIHLGPHAFPEIGGQVVQVAAFIVNPMKIAEYRGSYKRLIEGQSHEKESRFHTSKTYTPSNADFAKIPGSPVAYWLAEQFLTAFAEFLNLGKILDLRIGMRTGDNERFLRLWHEVSYVKVGFGYLDAESVIRDKKKWIPYNKGGEFRKWFGNIRHVVNWENNGYEVKESTRLKYPELGDDLGWKISNESFYFREAITWTDISSSCFGVRIQDPGVIFSDSGSCGFIDEEDRYHILALLASKYSYVVLQVLNPTLHFKLYNLACIPVNKTVFTKKEIVDSVKSCIQISRTDWDSFETSLQFSTLPILQPRCSTLIASQQAADAECLARFARMKELEEENNRLFIEAYGLQDELSPEVPDDQITLYRPDRLEDIKRLISYAIGCVMGRFSLDKPGLIYAHSGNQGFDPSQYATFRADDDGIIPLLDNDWGIRDDATNRIIEFIGVAWSSDNLEENLKFIADSLNPESKESARETIRHYLSTGFYKHHLSMYKKRPIYWLFSSGKQRAFQCLVYLHRYNEGTLSRMRTEYVIPLMGKLNARLEHLQGTQDLRGQGGEIGAATSTTLKRKIEKERDTVKKQIVEIQAFDARLRHYADLRIKLDLDDGVKVNYSKFSDPDYGDILAEVKAICGTKDED